MIAYILDIVILLVLAFFAWRGGKKGLILTMFSCLALFVAYFGAKTITSACTGAVANMIRPSIQNSINEMLDGETPYDQADSEAASPSPTLSVTLPGQSDTDTLPSSDFTLGQIADALRESQKFTGLLDFLEDAIEEKTLEVKTTAVDAVSGYLSEKIAGGLLFGGSFLLILLLWFLISRALDLAFRLPILSALNVVGGAFFGLLKGLAVVMVSLWLMRLFGVLSEDKAGPLANLLTIRGLSELLCRLTENL